MAMIKDKFCCDCGKLLKIPTSTRCKQCASNHARADLIWTPQETAILEKYYGTMPVKKLAAMLPNRHLRAIYTKATMMKLQKPQSRGMQVCLCQS